MMALRCSQKVPNATELLEKIDTITQRDDVTMPDLRSLEQYYDDLLNTGSLLWRQQTRLHRLIKKYLEEGK